MGASGTVTAFAGASLHGHFSGWVGFSLGAEGLPEDDFCFPQQCFDVLTSDEAVLEATVDSLPSRAVVQQQSKGPTSSDSTNW